MVTVPAFSVVAALSVAAAGPPSPEPPVLFGDCTLTPEVVAAVGSGHSPEELFRRLHAHRRSLPATFGATLPPAGPVRLPGEFEPRSGLLLVWPEEPDQDAVALAIIRAAWQVVPVTLIVEHADAAAKLRVALTLADLPRDAVRVVQLPFNSIWLRDFGPIVVATPDGPVAVDPDYPPDCLADDALPTRLSGKLDLPVARMPWLIEGGNLLSDGAGTCFTTPSMAAENGRADWSDGVLTEWFGCQRVVELQPLAGEAIPHIDLLLAVADPHTLLVGRASREDDPDNAARLDLTADRLAAMRALDGQPYRVVRVPMVPLERGVRGDNGGPLVRSWLNLVPVNDVVLVPVYRGADPVVQFEALTTIGAAFPGRRVVPVTADALAPLGGTLHCITQTVPAR